MGKKKNTPTAGATGLPALRIGTRVRCTDDGVEGRIAWANAVSVKIKWDDGEEVTWKRVQLAGKPIEFLDAEPAGPEQPPAEPVPEQPTAPEATVTEPEVAPPPAEQVAPTEAPVAEPPAVAPPPAEPVATSEAVREGQAETPAAAGAPAPATESSAGEPLNTELPGGFAIKKRQRKPKPADQSAGDAATKKLSAIDAAAKVLADTGTPMSCKELIGAMAVKGYWTSPGGKTPDATLNTAVTMLPKCAPEGAISKRAG
jgi:hypothetical protein